MLTSTVPEIVTPDADAGASATPVGERDELSFRNYRLLPGARMLLRNGCPVPIGSRAFDILHVLARARGTIVGKNAIVDAAWPTTIVEESNLRFQVAQLRKALGEDQDLVKTIPGRGYLLCAESRTLLPSDGRGGVDEESASRDLFPQAISPGRPEASSACLSIGSGSDAQLHLRAFLSACGISTAQPVILMVDLRT